MTKPHSNYELLRDLEQLLTERPAIEAFANDWEEGFPTGAGDGPGGKGGHSDRTYTQAIAGMPDHREDVITGHLIATHIPHREGHGLTDQLHEVTQDLDAALVLIRRAAKNWRRLRPDDHAVAQMRQRQQDTRSTGVGQCACVGCDHWCTGGRDDRLKTGMCPRHYRAWRRNLEADTPLSLDEFRQHAVGDMGDNAPPNNDGLDAPHPNSDAVPFGSISAVRPDDAA